MAVEWHTVQVWAAVIVGRNENRLAVWSPGGPPFQIKPIGNDACVAAVGLHGIKVGSPSLPRRKRDALAIGRDGRSCDDLRVAPIPQLGILFIRQLPDAFACAVPGNVEQETCP